MWQPQKDSPQYHNPVFPIDVSENESNGIVEEKCHIGDQWYISATRSHILHSCCNTSVVCNATRKLLSQTVFAAVDGDDAQGSSTETKTKQVDKNNAKVEEVDLKRTPSSTETETVHGDVVVDNGTATSVDKNEKACEQKKNISTATSNSNGDDEKSDKSNNSARTCTTNTTTMAASVMDFSTVTTKSASSSSSLSHTMIAKQHVAGDVNDGTNDNKNDVDKKPKNEQLATTASDDMASPNFADLHERKRRLESHRNRLCDFCYFDLLLSMAHLPDMTYPFNCLRLHHSPSGMVLEFNVLDALMPVVVKRIGLPDGLKVSPAAAWLRARLDCAYTRNVCNANTDWTFTTDYRGTLYNEKAENKKETMLDTTVPTGSSDSTSITFHPTTDRIDMDKLKQREKIYFYNEVDLYEDELADHGVASCSVKIRVMYDSFFILLRYFLRVDNVFVRFNDTRYYHEFGTNYLLREYSNREGTMAEIAALAGPTQEVALLVDPVDLYNHTPLKVTQMEKISFNNLLSSKEKENEVVKKNNNEENKKES